MDIKRLTTQASLRAFRPGTRRGPQGSLPPIAPSRPASAEPEMLTIEPGASRDLLAAASDLSN